MGVASRPADPREARTRYLDRLPPEEQAAVMRRAEKAGPGPDDADWFVAEAAASAAERIEAAAARIERVLGARPGAAARAVTPGRDLALYAGGLASAVLLASTLAWFGPRGGALSLSFAATAALVVAALVALWREAPKPRRILPTRELVAFAGGLLAAVAIAWLVTVGHIIPLPMRFAVVSAAGVAFGLLWRSKR